MRYGFYAATMCIAVLSTVPSASFAAKDDTVSLGAFLGDSYAPNGLRLSIKKLDIGITDLCAPYVGSRLWLESYYAGFGVGIAEGGAGAAYGVIGYEWQMTRFVRLAAEFDGNVSADGGAAGRGYIGIVVGG